MIVAALLNKYRDFLIKSGVSPSTVERKLSSVRVYLNFLEKKGYLAEDPEIKKELKPNEILEKLSLLGIDTNKRKSGQSLRGFVDRIKALKYILPYQIKYGQPKWLIKYRKQSYSRWINLSLLIIFCVGLGVGIYDQFGRKIKQEGQILGTIPVSVPSFLSFQGRLTDQCDTPIVTEKSFTFSIYNIGTGGKALWTETKNITPDTDGIFNTLIGDTTTLDRTIFKDNMNLYLGVAVGGDPEMTDRQQIATVGYAFNSQYLQGYGVGATGTGANINEIPVVDSNGNLGIAASNPTLQTTNGTFTIKSPVLILTTTGNGNITLNPGGTGGVGIGTTNPTEILTISKVQNASTKILVSNTNAGASAYAGIKLTSDGGDALIYRTSNAYTVRQAKDDLVIHESGGGDIVFWGATEIARFSNSGNLGIGTTTPSQKLDVNGNIRVGSSGIFNAIGVTSSGLVTNLNADYLDNLHASSFLQVGSTGAFISGSGTVNFLPKWTSASIQSDSLLYDDGAILGTSANVGIGTTLPTATLHVLGSGYVTGSFNVGVGITSPLADLGSIRIGGTNVGLNTDTDLLSFASGVLTVNGSVNVGGTAYVTGFRLDSEGVLGKIMQSTDSLGSANWATLTAGTGIGITNVAGAITIYNSGVGTTYNAGSGLTLATSIFKLGGAITENTRLNIGDTEVMYLSYPSGNVGIGNTAPTAGYKLDVTGNLNVSGNINVGSSGIFNTIGVTSTGLITNLNADLLDGLHSSSFVGTGATAGFTTGSGTTNFLSKWSAAKVLTDSLLYDDGAVLGTSANMGIGNTSPLTLFSVGSNPAVPALAVTSGGNVGIGTTGPDNKLTINGSGSEYPGINIYDGGVIAAALGDGRSTNEGGELDLYNNGSQTVLIMGDSSLPTYFNAGNNVGIGTTGPTQKLDINGNLNVGGTGIFSTLKLSGAFLDSANQPGSANMILQSTGTGTTWVSATGIGGTYTAGNGLTLASSVFKLGGALTENTRLNIGNTEVMYLSYPSGNVGIGTTGPGQKLDIYQGNIALRIADNGTQSIFGYEGTDINPHLGIDFNYAGVGAANALQISDWSGGSTSPLVTFQRGGNVGIGTTLPTYKLDVTGDGRFTTNLNVGGTLTLSQGAFSDFLLQSDSSGNARWVSAVGIGGTYTAGNGLTLASSVFKLGGTLTENTRLNIGGTEVMYVSYPSGNVGIGTTEPSSKLHIKGSNSIATVGVGNTLTADGTFDTSTGWSVGVGWTVADSVVTHITGNVAALSGTSDATSTTTVYQVNLGVAVTTGGTGFNVSLGGQDSGTTFNTAGTKTVYIKPADSSGTLSFTPNLGGTFVGTIDTVTIYALTASVADSVIESSDGTGTPLEIRAGGSDKYGLFLGQYAGQFNTSVGGGGTYGLYNVFIGNQAGRYNTTGYQNTANGYQALYSNTIGYYNTANGFQALYNNTTGYTNTADGSWALYSNTNGIRNTAIGYKAMYSNIGSYNTGTSTTGSWNTALGTQALYSNTIGINSVAIGYLASYANTTGGDNTIVGKQAFYTNTTGSLNTALGNYTLLNLKPTSKAITAFADSATSPGTKTTVTSVGVGLSEGATGIGIYGTTNYNGTTYTATNVTADTFDIVKVFVGNDATGWWGKDSEGKSNTAVGYGAGSALTTGSSNLFLGYQAGNALTTGSTNIVIGYDIDLPAVNISNMLDIGNLIYATGLAQTGTTLSTGNVGIGTTGPTQKLDINGNINVGRTGIFSTLKLSGTFLDSANQPGSANMVLTSTGTGTTWVAATGYTAGNGLTLASYVFKLGGALTENTRLNIGNTEVMYLSYPSGNVGIGTTGTSSKLHVKGSSSIATVGANTVLTADGTFDTSTDWTVGVGWTVDSSMATHSTGNTAPLSGTSTATSTSTVYQVNFTIGVGATAGSGFTVSLGGADSSYTFSTAGTKTFYIKPADSSGTLSFTPGSAGTFEGTIDTVTIYPLTASVADSIIESSNGTATPLEIRAGGNNLSNTFIGNQAGKYNVNGFQNAANGMQALYSNISGYDNNATGYQALYSNISGIQNTADGYQALFSNLTGQNLTAIGFRALYSNTTGYQNDAVGTEALYSNTSGYQNTAIGRLALWSNTTGNYNTASGYLALTSATTAWNNTAQGSTALRYNTTGYENTAQGAGALEKNTTGYWNTAQGVLALNYNTTAVHNSAVGYEALQFTTTGSNNTAMGRSALKKNTTGYDNVALGAFALYNAVPTSGAITAFADSGTSPGTKVTVTSAGHGLSEGTTGIAIAGTTNYDGTYTVTNVTTNTFDIVKVFVGNDATGWWGKNSEGHSNVAVGAQAGSTIIKGDSNTFLGNYAGYNALQKTDAVNSMALGNGAYTTASNQVVIGNTSITQTLLNGNVGIGTTNPTQLLWLEQSAATSGTRLVLNNTAANEKQWHLISGGTTSSGGTGNFAIRNGSDGINGLVINPTGNVGIGTTGPTSLLHLASTSTSTSFTGFNLNWNPGSSTTLTGDLFAINIGSSGSAGNLFNILDDSSSLFSVSETAMTSNQTANFTSSGDVAIAYNINFTNPTASYIKSAAPLYLEAGEVFNSSDLTLRTYNSGNIILESANLWADGTNVGIGTTSQISKLDINIGVVKTDTTQYGYPSLAIRTNEGVNYSNLGINFIGAAAQANRGWQFQSGESGIANSGNITFQAYGGNVGIGTTAPGARLQVNSEIHVALGAYTSLVDLTAAANNGTLDVRGVVGGAAVDSIYLNGNSTAGTANYIKYGFLGIGETSPTSPIEIRNGTAALSLDASISTGRKWQFVSYDPAPSNYVVGPLYIRDETTSTNRFMIDTNGNVGIGTTTTAPLRKLDINSQIIRMNETIDADTPTFANIGDISIGARGLGTGFTAATDGRIWIRSNTTTPSTFEFRSAARYADYSEFFYQGSDLSEPGDLMTLDKENPSPIKDTGRTKKSSTPYQNNLLGVVTTIDRGTGYNNPDNRQDDPQFANVGILGHVQVKVSTENGPIKEGDYLTSSSIPGVAMKATKACHVVGRALESHNDPNPQKIGKVMALINVTWYDPDVYLTSTGDLFLNTGNFVYNGLLKNEIQNESKKFKVSLVSTGETINRIIIGADGVFARIKTGFLQTTNLIADNILAKRIRVEEKIISPVIDAERIDTYRLNTEIISPLAENLTLDLKNSSESAFGRLLVKGENDQTVFSLDASGSAEFTGNVAIGEDLAVLGDATVSGEFTANELVAESARIKKLKAESIEGLEALIANITSQKIQTENISGLEATPSSELADLIASDSGDLATATDSAWLAELAKTWATTTPSEDIKIEDNITILGVTSLAQTIVSGSLSQDGTLLLSDGNSINVLGGTLYLQDKGLGGIDLLAGKVTIDTLGNAIFEGDLTVKGTLFAQTIEATGSAQFTGNIVAAGFAEIGGNIVASGSAKVSELNINRDGNLLEPSPDGVFETSASAGTAILADGTKEVIIRSPFVKEGSLVYLTPIGSTGNRVIYLKSMDAEEQTITIGIDTYTTKELQFNWWIVN